MKNFFEFMGFAATAMFSGFLVFLYIGHTKNLPRKTDFKEPITAVSDDGIEYETAPKKDPSLRPMTSRKEVLPDFQTISTDAAGENPGLSDKRKKPSSKPVLAEKTEKPAPVESSGNIYDDEVFVENTIKKWQKRVSAAAAEHELRPDLLMANVIVRAYAGSYSERHFENDAETHSGDAAMPETVALRQYDNTRTMANLIRMYDLESRFPTPTAPKWTAKSPEKKASVPAPKRREASKKSDREEPRVIASAKTGDAKVTPKEKNFREMVAKEHGFRSWEKLQTKADRDLRSKAERRVKLLMTSSQIR